MDTGAISASLTSGRVFAIRNDNDDAAADDDNALGTGDERTDDNGEAVADVVADLMTADEAIKGSEAL